MGNEFSSVLHESLGIGKGLWLSTLAVVVAIAFNSFFDSLLQHIVPYQENQLNTLGQITMFRLLLVLFLIMILVASSIILSTKFTKYCRSKDQKKKKKQSTATTLSA